MIVVPDANALIGLAKGGCFDLLDKLFDRVLVPQELVDEVVTEGRGRPGGPELQAALGRWIHVQAPGPVTVLGLPDPTDRALLSLALSASADRLVSDDEELRKAAQVHGVQVLFVTEVLWLGKLAGHLPLVRPVMDRMQSQGFGIRDEVYQEILRRVGEAPS